MLLRWLRAAATRKDDAATEEKAPTQVAAKVNGTELTVHQVNYALQRIPNLEQGSIQGGFAAGGDAIWSTRKCWCRRRLTDKLDRDPTVVQALDAARRQILAEAYMSRKLGTPAEPSDAEVSDYFDQNPELFAKRKIYRLQEISIKAPKDKHDAIRAQLGCVQVAERFCRVAQGTRNMR